MSGYAVPVVDTDGTVRGVAYVYAGWAGEAITAPWRQYRDLSFWLGAVR